MSKPNNNVVEQIHKLSQLDGQEVLKDVHSHPGHYLRVRDANTEVDRDFDTFSVSYNNNNLPIEICYYKGASPHITDIAFTSDSSGSLNNKYFIIYSSKSGKAYHIWYNVNGSGIDPDPGNTEGIEVQINTNEPAATVAEATLLTINAFIPNNYTLRRKNTVLTITNLVYGEISDTINGNTTFLINNISGKFEEVEKILIEYDTAGNPIYKGNTLYGYRFNLVTGQFELDNVLDENTINNEIIYNITVNSVDTEFSHTLSNGTKEYLIRTRDKRSVLKLAFVENQSGTNYVTISGLSSYSSKNLKAIGRTLYFQTPTQPTVVEIVEKL